MLPWRALRYQSWARSLKAIRLPLSTQQWGRVISLDLMKRMRGLTTAFGLLKEGFFRFFEVFGYKNTGSFHDKGNTTSHKLRGPDIFGEKMRIEVFEV